MTKLPRNNLEEAIVEEIIRSVVQIAYWNNIDLEDDDSAALIKRSLLRAAEDSCWDPINEKQLTLPLKIKE